MTTPRQRFYDFCTEKYGAYQVNITQVMDKLFDFVDTQPISPVESQPEGDTGAFFHKWMMKNNPFFPNDMRWDKEIVFQVLEEYASQLPIPEPATGSEWVSDEEIERAFPLAEEDYIVPSLRHEVEVKMLNRRQGAKWMRDLMHSRLPVTPKVEWDELFNDLGKFTVEKFPDAGPKEHLKKLIIEAIEAIDDPTDITEYADCLLAVFGAAYKAGFTSHLLYKAGCDKMIINKKREWEKLPDGTYQHKSAITTPPQTTKENG